MARATDPSLKDALTKGYTARAKLFYEGIVASGISSLIAEINAFDGTGLKWELPAVVDQIKTDGQVRDWFNLTEIVYGATERKRFLERLFHIVDTPM